MKSLKHKLYWLAPLLAVTMTQPAHAAGSFFGNVTSINEVNRQISRAIADRVEVNFESARFDNVSEQSNVWDSLSYTSIEVDKRGDLDLFQAVLGADKRWKSLNAGIAVNYARSEGFGDKSNMPGFIPYADFNLNKFMHVTALAGYVRSEGVGDNSFTIDTALTDFSLNGDLPIVGGLSFKPRAGYRFAYSDYDFNRAGSISTYTNTLYGQGGLDYTFGNISAYFGALYERSVLGLDLPNLSSECRNCDLVFIRAALDYQINNRVSLGVAYRHQLLEQDIDSHQGSARMSMRF